MKGRQITWAQVIGIAFVFLGRCIIDGQPGVSGRGNEPQVLSPSCKERNKAIISISTQPKKCVTTRTCIIGKPRRDTGITHSVALHHLNDNKHKTAIAPNRVSLHPLPPLRKHLPTVIHVFCAQAHGLTGRYMLAGGVVRIYLGHVRSPCKVSSLTHIVEQGNFGGEWWWWW